MQIFIKEIIGLIILLIFYGSIFLTFRRRLTLSLVGFIALLVTTVLSTQFSIFIYIFSILFFGAYIYFRRQDQYSDLSYFDYQDRIFSIGGIINKLKRAKKDDIIIGEILPTSKRSIKFNNSKLVLSDVVRSAGCLIAGSSGSGKSTTLKSIMGQAAKNGNPITFFDYKGEDEILDYLENLAKELNIPYYEFSNRLCNFTYDPFTNLNETGKVEALLNTRRWSSDGSDEHYKTSTQLLLQGVIKSYDKYRYDNNERISYIPGLHRFLVNEYRPSPNEKDGYNTLLKQLQIILSSKAGELFKPKDHKFSFNKKDQYIVAFSFTSANKSLANSISSFAFQDLMDRGTREPYNKKLCLCIDEFGTLENSKIIKDILEKGRSGGIQPIFSILDINQIAMTSGEYFVNSILGTINTLILFAGATTKTAEIMAGVSKYANIDDMIMSLEKPQNGKPPTALVISKFKILNDRGAQEIHKIIPYIFKLRSKDKINEKLKVEVPIIEREEIKEPIKLNSIEEGQIIDIDNIDDQEVLDFNDLDDFL